MEVFGHQTYTETLKLSYFILCLIVMSVLSCIIIWMMLLLGQLNGYRSCIQKERKALLELKKYVISQSVEDSSNNLLTTWTNDTKSNCCLWKGIKCNRTSGRVTKLFVSETYFKDFSLLNLSLLHPFEELRSLNLSAIGNYPFSGFFDDIEGYRSLRRLKNLKIMDLSSNEFNSSIFPFLNAATSLTTLFLRRNNMEGPFTAKELKDLTNLEVLDLSQNRLNVSMSDLTHMKKLKVLDLSENDFSSSMELKELKDLTSLEVLDLSRNRLNGYVSEFTHLKKLKALDLGHNDFVGSTNLEELKNLTNLEALSLASNSFSGSKPIEVICEMKNLRELDLTWNYFVGQLPSCFGNLSNLRVLDLSLNQFNGELPSSFSGLESLEYLSLLDNNFTGLFSLNPLTNFTKLKVFKLSSTSDMVQVETASSWQPKFQLSVVVQQLCSLEKIPSFLMYQKSLRLVDLSNNRLSGNIPTWLLANNQELEVLLLKNNSFTIFQMPTIVHHLQVLDFSANNVGALPDNIGGMLPNLLHMYGSNNGIQGHFPMSMGEMKNISLLDLSYNNFSGEIPRSFFTGCSQLNTLILAHNKFTGHFLPRGTSFGSLYTLRIDNNLFTGKIEVGLRSSTTLSILDMSNNCLTGSIPSWVFERFHLEFLLLSNNFLHGTLPPSLVGLPSLTFMDLSGNLLSGAVPSHVRCMHGANLFLQDNFFTGPVPDTLLESVQVLNLENNKLFGSIPEFVNTQDINILLLRGNNLTGAIPRQLCDLSNIRILDLSYNKLKGSIPSCLYNLSFGREGEEEMVKYVTLSYTQAPGLHWEFYKSVFVVESHDIDFFITYKETEISFAAKQRYDSYTGESELSKGVLGFMYGMDLSNNELSGVIPAELGDLMKLRAMNLSFNLLSSSIPSSFSNLKDIESIDLSYNMLQGSIPHQLTSLTSLAVFDVSYNSLSGIIPQGRQFNTFKETSYLGNPLLCGPPTKKSCESKKVSEEVDNGGQEEDDEATIDMLVFYFSTGSTLVTTLICIFILMCFDCPWRRAWLCMVDAFVAWAKNM